jgi:hypothetical protein
VHITPNIIKIGLNIPISGIVNNVTIAAIIPAIPRIPNIIAPTNSCLEDIIKITNKIIDGRLCINKAKAHIKKPLQLSKTSKEKIAKKSANKISNILGVQNMNLFNLAILLLIV